MMLAHNEKDDAAGWPHKHTDYKMPINACDDGLSTLLSSNTVPRSHLPLWITP